MRDSSQLRAYEPLTDSLAGLLKAEYPVVQQSDFDHYGEVIVKLAFVVRAQNASLNLGMLRGAYRPCVIVEVMTREGVKYKFLNYTQHRNRGSEIMADLGVLLKQRDPQTEEFRIQVTDTAIGGDGSEHCAQMMIGIKE